ncbi:hypothetical protein EV209_1031 [Cuneatibacter caecimuris]|uniref:Phage-related protein n=1 Tax=Cuneatibacter caecimuris TaxID=1796618 RepID=A0A4Q7PPG8_9FIRM|nr:hypothetical protein [Cuneatibacter caecimuris]RZT02901.1 hypothetical protein EV209_1031 [Cuneatibacter caecimuris]
MSNAMTLETLQVVLDAYTRPYREEMAKVKQETQKVTDQIKQQTQKVTKETQETARQVSVQTRKMENSWKSVKRVIGSVVSVAAIVSFTKSCLELGSDLAEVQNVVDVAFGSMSGAVNAFAADAIEQFGMSELAAKKYMGTYGAMAKSMGLNAQEVYDMSAAITGLTGDVSSFYNIAQDEAYTKLKSIFTGETESLKEIGVIMTQTALDQYALNNGFGETTAKMTEQEKVMLRYQYVMSSLSDASGDFLRTQDSWANQTRILSLRFQQLRATMGQGLINAFLPVIKIINTVLARLQVFAQYFSAIMGQLFGAKSSGGGGSGIADISVATAGIADNMSGAESASGGMAKNAKDTAKAAKEIKNELLAFDEMNRLSDNSASDGGADGGGGSGGGIGDLGDLDVGSGLLADMNQQLDEYSEKAAKYAEMIRKAFQDLKDACKPTTDALKRLWDEGLSKLGNFTWTAIKDFWEAFLKPLGAWTLGEGLPEFLDITNDLLNEINWKKLNESLKNFWGQLEKLAKFAFKNLLSFYRDFLKPVGVWVMNDALPALVDVISNLLSAIDWDRLNSAISEFWEALSRFTIGIGRGIVKFFEDIGKVLSPLIADLVNAFSAAMEGLADIINSIPTEVLEAIGEGIGVLLGAFLAYKAATGIASIVSGIGSAFGGLISGLAAHPYIAIAGGITGLATALGSLASDGFFSDDETRAMCGRVDTLIEKSEEGRRQTQEFLDTLEGKYSNIESSYGALEDIADRYFDLSEKIERTNEEQTELDSLRQTLERELPGFGDIIKDQTKDYEDQKEEIQRLIEKTKDYYMAQAAQESLVDIYTKVFESQRKISEAQEERNNLEDKYKEQLDFYKDWVPFGETVASWLDPTIKRYDDLNQYIAQQQSEQEELQAQLENAYGIIDEYNGKVGETSDCISSVVDATRDLDFSGVATKSAQAIDEAHGIWVDGKQVMSTDALELYNAIMTGELSKLPDGTYKTAEGAIVAMGTAFEDGKPEFLSTVESLQNESIGTLKSFYDQYKKSGIFIVEGAIEGINDKSSAFGGTMRNLFDLAYEQFKLEAAIHSPSRKMYESGSNIGQGAIDGVNSRKGNLLTLMGDLPNEMQRALGDLKYMFSSSGIKIAEGLGKGFDDAWNQGVNLTFATIPRRIADAIGSLYHIGVNAAQTLADGFRAVHIPAPHYRVSTAYQWAAGQRLALPDVNVSWYARGGIIDSPTLAMMGEAGREAVVPLERTEWIDTLADRISERTGGNGEAPIINVYVGGKKVTDVVVEEINKRTIQNGKSPLYI